MFGPGGALGSGRGHFRGTRAEVQAGPAHGRAMMLLGLLSRANGCCPSCGRDVARTHAFDGLRLLDTYACGRCGPTAYQVRV